MRTVRDAAFEVLRGTGLTTIFGHPGATEVPFLSDLPDDFEFVLGLHEGAVVGMATGWSTARERPALVNLHGTAGLGNAVGALATARLGRVPMVVLVGQRDRRDLAAERTLPGRGAGAGFGEGLDELGGRYPVRVEQPERAQDVPGALARAYRDAMAARGPVVVIVPAGDWAEPADPGEVAVPEPPLRTDAVPAEALEQLFWLVAGADSPAIVVGGDVDDRDSWSALAALAERLGSPVWQEPLSARAGFPQNHPRFAGHLPEDRERLSEVLRGYDVLLVVGAPLFGQLDEVVGPGTRVALVAEEPARVPPFSTEFAVVVRPAPVCRALAERLPARAPAVAGAAAPPARPSALPPAGPARVGPPSSSEPMRALHVLAALGERIPADCVVVEESRSSRSHITRLLPARSPLGYLSAGAGGLGFALPAAIGVRMAQPHRPVVAVVGDGSALHGIQALWSAAHYVCGVLFVVLGNGRFAAVDRLARGGGSKPPWPAFEEASVRATARGLGCPAERVDSYPDLLTVLDEVVPTLADRINPLVLEVAVGLD